MRIYVVAFYLQQFKQCLKKKKCWKKIETEFNATLRDYYRF